MLSHDSPESSEPVKQKIVTYARKRRDSLPNSSSPLRFSRPTSPKRVENDLHDVDTLAVLGIENEVNDLDDMFDDDFFTKKPPETRKVLSESESGMDGSESDVPRRRLKRMESNDIPSSAPFALSDDEQVMATLREEKQRVEAQRQQLEKKKVKKKRRLKNISEKVSEQGSRQGSIVNSVRNSQSNSPQSNSPESLKVGADELADLFSGGEIVEKKQRNASKKALLEMQMEASRLIRESQATLDIVVPKKLSMADFLANQNNNVEPVVKPSSPPRHPIPVAIALKPDIVLEHSERSALAVREAKILEEAALNDEDLDLVIVGGPESIPSKPLVQTASITRINEELTRRIEDQAKEKRDAISAKRMAMMERETRDDLMDVKVEPTGESTSKTLVEEKVEKTKRRLRRLSSSSSSGPSTPQSSKIELPSMPIPNTVIYSDATDNIRSDLFSDDEAVVQPGFDQPHQVKSKPMSRAISANASPFVSPRRISIQRMPNSFFGGAGTTPQTRDDIANFFQDRRESRRESIMSPDQLAKQLKSRQASRAPSPVRTPPGLSDLFQPTQDVSISGDVFEKLRQLPQDVPSTAPGLSEFFAPTQVSQVSDVWEKLREAPPSLQQSSQIHLDLNYDDDSQQAFEFQVSSAQPDVEKVEEKRVEKLQPKALSEKEREAVKLNAEKALGKDGVKISSFFKNVPKPIVKPVSTQESPKESPDESENESEVEQVNQDGSGSESDAIATDSSSSEDEVMQESSSSEEEEIPLPPPPKRLKPKSDFVLEEAEEEEDEFFGMGGADGEDDEDLDQDLKDLIATGKQARVDANWEAIVKLHRKDMDERDQEELNRLLHDVTTGNLRKRRRNAKVGDKYVSDDDSSDDELFGKFKEIAKRITQNQLNKKKGKTQLEGMAKYAANPATAKFASVFMKRRAQVEDETSDEEELDLKKPKPDSSDESQSEDDGFVVDDEDELELERMEDEVTGRNRLGDAYDLEDNAAHAESHGYLKQLKRNRLGRHKDKLNDGGASSSSSDEVEVLQDEVVGRQMPHGRAKKSRKIESSDSEEELVLDTKESQFTLVKDRPVLVPVPTFTTNSGFERSKSMFARSTKSSLGSLDPNRVAGLVKSFEKVESQSNIAPEVFVGNRPKNSSIIPRTESQSQWGQSNPGQSKESQGPIGFAGLINKLKDK